MTVSVRRPSPRSRSFRLRLALGTALAGGTLAIAPAARAQTLPTGGTVIVPAAGTVTVDGGAALGTINAAAGASTLDIGLQAPATVINWTTFNVVGASAATPATVNFSAALANSVVVNRVTTAAASTISNGQVTTYATLGDSSTKQNTSVWLLNPSGILIGGASVVDAGAFMGSTLDVCAAAACTAGETLGLATALTTGPSVRLFGAATTTAAVSVRDTARIVTGDTLVLVGGAVEVQPGTTLDAAGDVQLVAATDVQVRRPGSPLILQINAGTQVAGTLISTGGSITGDSVVVAAARPDGLAEALLSVGGTVTARGVATNARGIVLLGGTGTTEPSTAVAGDPTVPAPSEVISVAAGNTGSVGIGGTATLIAQGADVIVNGTGAVTVAGPVDAARDYLVSGRTVTLGTAAASRLQEAGGAVIVRATGSDIAGLGALMLRSNRLGATGGSLTLASASAIRFGDDTAIVGGSGTAAGGADIRILEAATATETRFGAVTGRSLGGIPAAGGTAPLPLTLYGPTTFGTVTLDRGLDLAVANGGGGAVGSLTAASFATGVNAADNGGGSALVDDIGLTAAGNVRLGFAESRTGGVAVTARDGDITGLAAGAGYAYTSLTAASGRASVPGVLGINDGNVGVYAGRSRTGALTATGTNGLVQLAAATAGNDVTVFAQKIEAGTIQAAAASASPITGTAPGGFATLHAYAHDVAAGAVDLRVGTVSSGSSADPRRGLDVQLVADAVDGTIVASTLNADRNVAVLAGSGANGLATVAGGVRAGRLDATGEYAVTAGQVTLGTPNAAVQQSAPSAVSIRSTASDIYGFGALTLQSNSDGAAGESLTLNSGRAISFDATSRLFAGNGTAAGNSDLLVYESGTATSTSFGQVRARRLGSAAGGATLFLYGPTRFGTVDLDRSLFLYVGAGSGGEPGSLTAGALTLGVNPVDDGTGMAVADTLFLTTSSDTRLISATSRTGSLSITAIDGDVSGLTNAGGGYDRAMLSAARADAGATQRIADGTIAVFAGRNGSGALTATGAAGLALLGDVTAGSDVRVDAQAVDTGRAQSDRGTIRVRAGAAAGTVTNAATEVLTLGAAISGLGTTLTADGGSLRVGTVDAGRVAVPGTSTGAVRLDTYGNARIGVVAPTLLVPGGIATQVGDIAVQSQHGDITGGGTSPAFGRADLAALDGNIFARADAVALTATPVGLIQLGTVFAQTREAQAGATTAPVRGNIYANGRVVDISRAETAGIGDGTGGLLSLTAAEGSAVDDVHLTLGAGFIGTTATLIAGSGSSTPAAGANGTVSVGNLIAGRNRLAGPGAALPGTITIDAVESVRADALTSLTGNVVVNAANGDVRGYLSGNGRLAATAAIATAASGDSRAVANGTIAIRSASPVPGRGVATIGSLLAGDNVSVQADTIDAAGQVVQSVGGAVVLAALSGDVTLGTASAGRDIVLDAVADPGTTRGPGTVNAAFLTAGRNIDIRADANAVVTDDVTAGLGGAGYYHVTAGGSAVLGDDSTLGALADPDLQSAVDDVRIVSLSGGIIGNRRLVLRSNSSGQGDGTGDADGVRDLTLDAADGAIAFALPDGFPTTAARDVDTARLIGGSDASPQQSAVRVRAAAGTTLSLGNVTARALRAAGPTPVAGDRPDFAARSGANPLYHDGDIRVGQVDVAESLGIFAYGPAGAPDRLLQIDGARSRTGNVELFASGDLRGYQLTAPSAGTPLGIYVASDLTAGGARVDARASSVLLDDVAAGAFAGIATTTGRLRVDTVSTGTASPLAESGISLVAQTDLRLTSALATRGDVVASATTGSITGLASPDNGTLAAPFALVTGIVAADGNLSVSALGAGSGTGLVAATALTARSSETSGAAPPARGNLSVIGQQIGVDTATAQLGGLSFYARPGGTAPVATGILLGTGAAGTTAGITVDTGSISAPGQANGSAVIGTLTAGTNAQSGGATALAGNATVTAAGNIRVGTIESRTGSVTLTARDADVTGNDDGTGAYGRANLSAAVARAAIGGAPAIADGAIGVYAGRDPAGALTATGSNGLARLGTLTAGGNVAVLAQAIDTTAAASSNGAILVRAYAADGAVTGSGGEALVLFDASSGLGTRLDATVGSVRATILTAGLLRNGTPGDIAIDAERDIRVGTARSYTGNVAVTARDGDVTGLADGGGFGRAILVAANAAPASGTQAAVADGNIGVFAGRDSSGALTATGNAGLARLGAVTAGANVTLHTQAIDTLRAEATRGMVAARAYAGDAAVPGSAGDSLVLTNADSGLGTTLTSAAGSIRSSLVSAALTSGATGDVVIDAARNVRVDTARTATGSVTITARDGDVTGLAAATGFDRANFTAGGTAGDVGVYAGRDATAVFTATGTNGLALLGAVTAGRDVAILAQAIDATSAEAGGTITGRTYAADGGAPSTGGEALVLVDALSGLGTTLSSTAGSIRTNVAAARATGLTGAILIDAARDVRVGTGQTAAGTVTITAQDGDVTGLSAGSVFGRANLAAGGADGDVGVYAGRDTSGTLTASGANGLALLSTVTATRDVTILAQAIDATRLDAGRTIGARAYAADGTVGSAGEALALVDALSGQGTTLTTTTGSVRASTIIAGRASGTTGNVVIDSARDIRIGVTQTASGSVTATARDGDITGLAGATGFDRAVLIAGGTAGDVGIYAGRDTAGAQTATAGNGLALIATSAAGRDVTILAQAIDATRLEAGGTIGARAYAANGAVGSAGEVLMLGDALSGLGTTLTATTGSVRSSTISAARTTGATGDVAIEAARDIRLGVARTANGIVTVTARDGGVTGLADDGAMLDAGGTAGDVRVYAGRDATGGLTATGSNGLALLGAITAARDITIQAQAIDASRLEAGRTIDARAYAIDGAVTGSGVESLALGDGFSGLNTALTATAGSVRASTITAARAAGATGDIAIDAARNARLGTVQTLAGSITVIARDGDVTGIAGVGGPGRAILDAGGTAGDVRIYAGRDAIGGLTATSASGIVLLDTATAGRDVTILAQAIDASRLEAGRSIEARAYAADGAVTGSTGEALVLGEALSGLGTTLTTTTGSVRASTITAARTAGATGDVVITSARDIRLGTVGTTSGSITATAVDGGVTGLAGGRAIVTATGTTGDVRVYAGRAADGTLTATGGNGVALIETATAGRDVTILAQAIDATRLEAGGTLTARAYAADGAILGSAGEALAVTEALSGLGTTLNTAAGSIRATTVIAARAPGATGDVLIDAARDARIGTATTTSGSITAFAVNGGVTGLPGATGLGRTTLSASGTTGDVNVYAGRSAGAAPSATAGNGLALIDAATAGRDVTILAQAIDATRLEAGGTITARAYAADGAVTGSVGDSIVVDQARSGQGTILTSAIGSIRASSVSAARAPGATADILLDAGRNVRLGTAGTTAGIATIVARDGDVTGFADGAGFGRAIVTAGSAVGDVRLYAGRDASGALTAGAGNGLALIDTASAGRDVTILAQAIDASRALAGGTVLARAYAADRAAPATGGESLVLVEARSGLATTLTNAAGSIRADGITAGGDVLVDAARNVRAGTAESVAGNLAITARDGDVTGLAGGAGFNRAILNADIGDIGVFAGRAPTGAQTATGANGLALLDTVTAGRDVTILAQAIDASRLEAGRSIDARAYAIDGAAAGSMGEALVLGEALSGSGTRLTTTTGSVRASTITAARTAGATGDIVIASARDIRLGTAQTVSGSVVATARDGDLTGLAGGRAIVTAGGAAGDIRIYAGRASDETLTATGANGLALLDTVTAGRDVTILAQAIDATLLDARAITARAYAADGVAPATGSESLIVVDALSRLGTTLTTSAGSIRAATIDAGRAAGGVGDVVVDAQRNVRVGTVASATGSLTLTARDGDVTGLASGTGFDRAILSTTAATGDIAIQAGRDSAGALTATGSAGLVLLDAITAGRDATMQAQAIDALTLSAGRAITARAYAADGAVTGGASESLLLDIAGAGGGITLASGGSIRATTVGAGQLRNGVAGDLVIDAARDLTLVSGSSTTGSVSVTARDGTVFADTLTAAIASVAQGAGTAIADGNLGVYAGRDAAGALTAIGSNGLARIGSLAAGNDVTVLAQKIDVGTVQAAAVSATPLAAGSASGTATLHAYAHDATSGAVDLTVGTVSSGTVSATRLGLDAVLVADAPGGTLLATTVGADRNVTALAGSGADGEAMLAGEVRAGRSAPAGAYVVAAGRVTLGTAAAPVEQSARGGVAITSTADDIVGLGTLTLQSNSDGPGRESLTLRAARGIVLPAGSRLFAGTDTADGTSDILVAEGASATLTTFGQVRGRSLGGVPTGAASAPVPLTLYGATTLGTVDLDRSLDLSVVGALTTGSLTVGRYPASGVADTITIGTSGPARFASLTSRTGGVAVGVTGTGSNLSAEGPIDAVGAILLSAAQDVTTTSVTSSTGRVQIGAGTGIASGDRVTASGGNIDVTAGTRATYVTLVARDAVTVTAGTIGVTTATAGTALAMTATGADTAAANGEALVLNTGTSGTTASLAATSGGVRATTIDSGQARNGTIGNLTVAAARNVSLETARSATGNVTVTARDGNVAATILTAAIASTPQGANAAIADGNVAVYAGRDPTGALTATGSNGFAQLGTVTAGKSVTVLAQKIDATTVQAAAVSATPLAGGAPSGSATLTAYGHDTATGAVDLRVGSVGAGTGSAGHRGQDVVLAASAPGGTLQATTLDADRNVSVTAGSGTNGTATVSGAVRAGRVDPAGTYVVGAGQVTLGTAGQAVEQSAAAATAITSTAGGVAALGALTLQSNRDGTGAEALEVRAAGGSVVFDPASTLRGGQAGGIGSNVTVAATGTGANVDVGTVGATGSTAALQADGSVTTRGPLTAATAALQAGGAITTNGIVTAPTTTLQAGGAITTNAAVAATTLSLRAAAVTTNGTLSAPTTTIRSSGPVTINGAATATTLAIQADGAITTNAAVSAPTLTFQTGTGATINGALNATTATLRAVGRVTTTAPVTATTLTVQSAQITFGNTLNATTIGLYNQATTANRTRLGGTTSAAETAFEIDQTEFNRITAATLLIGSGADDVSGQPLNTAWLRQDTDIGALTIAAGTGSTAIKVLGTAPANVITVTGAVSMNGGAASRTQNTRVLQLGGAAANTTAEIGQIRVVNDGAATDNTGSIATGGGILDLRAGLILAGKQAYIDEVARAGVDLSRNFVSNPNSSLYGAGPNGYLISGTPIDLITTGQLKLQFSNVALFQNTSRPGAIPTGVTITGASSTVADGQPLVLRSGSTALANGFALFGRFQPSATETFFSTQAALLGPNFISNGATNSNGVNPVSARLNGCLLSSASGGCLASSIAQPTLNVFDVTRDQVLRGSDNLVVTFDPLVGSNNEALFGDIAAGDFALQECPDGTTAAQCKPSGDAKP